MDKRIPLSFLFLFFITQISWGQNTGTITGKVTDENGAPILGVNVALLNTSRGAVTNAEGEYTISNIPPGTYTFRVSYVGYQTYSEEIQVQAGETLTKNVELTQTAYNLDELVVTGYGVAERREITGSITQVSSEDIQDIPVQNVEALLQGRAAGVQISTSSGNPGGGFQVQIRGEGSINAGNSPLYIVDGVQISFAQTSELNDSSPLNAIKASDIKSIEVLKDAAAAAIYGAQAANGVVLITTKSGIQGAPQISVSFEQGFRTTTREYDLLNTSEWLDYHIDAWGEETVRDILSGVYGYEEGVDFSQLRDYSWQDFIYRRGISRKGNVSVGGGTENTRYYISGHWENTEAQVKEVYFEQYQLRSNFDFQFTDKLSTQLNINLSQISMPGVCQDGGFVNCPFYQFAEEAPVSFPYLENGEYNPNTEEGLNNNQAVVFNEEDRETKITSITSSIAPTYEFTPWLSLSGLAGINWRYTSETDYESPIADPGDNGSVVRGKTTVSSLNANLVLNARQTFGEVHSLSGLIGGEYRRVYVDETELVGLGFPNNLLKVIDATAIPGSQQGFNSEFRIAGYFAQAKYSYDDRYYITLSGRYDGSSRFGVDNRWGFFPSASAGWRISEEEFFNADFIDNLKLRASYGVTGNSSIGNFAARGLYGVAGSYRGITGITLTQLANSRLTWEEAREINLGVDWSMFSGRFAGSIDVYRSINDELLLNRPLPISSGIASVIQNIGKVKNRGIEFEFRSINLNLNDFLWSSTFNVAIHQNEVLELTEGVKLLNPGDDDPIAIGHSILTFWMPRWAGVNPADGRPMWYDANGNVTYNPTQADNIFVDGGEEDVIGGFGNRFSYKGLSLNVFFQFSFGATAQPQAENGWLAADFENSLARVTERWREPGDMAAIPRAAPDGDVPGAASWSGTTSTNTLWDASYIRLKNITLSYSLPVALTDKLNVRNIRVYATGLNMVTWTSYIGVDPEVVGNETEASFPTARQFNLGIELQF